jgi:hypothetical protein
LLCVERNVTPINVHMRWTCEHLCSGPSEEESRRMSILVADSIATFLRCRELHEVTLKYVTCILVMW